MAQSLEIRWFFKHHKSIQKALDWFEAIGGYHNNPESTRVDFYLAQFNNGGFGIKLRNGQLEIKERISALHKHHSFWHDKGVIEVYNKCEFNIASDDKFSNQIITKSNHENWIPLTKQRRLIKITTPTIKVFPGSEIIDDGCSVEITKLIFKNEDWWTFCIEAYAKQYEINSNLEIVLEYISDTFKKLDEVVKPKLSMGYPRWLLSQIHS